LKGARPREVERVAQALDAFDFRGAARAIAALAEAEGVALGAGGGATVPGVRAEGPMSRSRILGVDGTPANIKILADLLRKDYLLSVATSGVDALEIAGSEDRPDLVLLDIMMPEMDGYEVCRRLKADPRTRDVPVIFVTAMSEVDDETKGFSL